MIKQLLKVLFLLLLVNYSLSAQTVAPFSLSPDWYFGQGGRLQFPGNNFPSSGNPTPLYKGTNTSVGVEASSSLCFSNGNVALYSNSQQVYNGTGTAWTDFIRSLVTDNTCAGSSTGACVFFPDPASPTNAFYLVTANDLTSGGCANRGVHRYRFTGTGATVAYNAGPTNMATTTFPGEAITCGTDGRGGYYVVVHSKGNDNTFRVWHFATSGTITQLPDQTVGAVVNDVSATQSYLKISPCQNKIAYFSGGILVVHDWDRTTGTVGTELRRVTGIGLHGVGLEFSPDGNRVFYSGQATAIRYVDIASGTTATIAGSASWSMQLGNNGRIYASPGGTSIGEISTPNATPSYGTVALPGGGSTFRGLSNIAWLTPQTPVINDAVTNCTVDLSHQFRNYFNSNVTVTTSTFSWNFGDGNSATNTLTPSHTYASNGTFNVSLSFNDTYCGQTWSVTKPVTVSCVLPVDYLDFTGQKSLPGATLNWITSSEKNNSYFLVQKSVDGINFQTIGRVNSKGNTSVNEYTFDDTDFDFGTAYYRLVQHDIDGAYSTSKVVTVTNTDVIIQIVPNPSQEQFTLQVQGADKVQMHLYDALGRLVLSQEQVSSDFLFGSGLANGTYIAKVFYGNEMQTVKLIKE